jgi:hypothetical protein
VFLPTVAFHSRFQRASDTPNAWRYSTPIYPSTYIARCLTACLPRHDSFFLSKMYHPSFQPFNLTLTPNHLEDKGSSSLHYAPAWHQQTLTSCTLQEASLASVAITSSCACIVATSRPCIRNHAFPNTLPIRLPAPISRFESVHRKISQKWSDQSVD